MSEQIDFIATTTGEPVVTCSECASLVPRNETANHEIWHGTLVERIQQGINDKLARS